MTGTGHQGDSRLVVQVDALSGEVLQSVEEILRAAEPHQGTGAYNGPGPLTIMGSSYSLPPPPAPKPEHGPIVYVLRDPDTRLSCADFATGQIFEGNDPVWGNGDINDRETQCVDALFAGQTHLQMLGAWLNRWGVDSAGKAVPIFVGAPVDQASHSYTRVVLGQAPAGTCTDVRCSEKPFTPLDIVGHEFGHGVDRFTPGRGSGKGTGEFVADVLGTATEWFADQAAPTTDQTGQ